MYALGFPLPDGWLFTILVIALFIPLLSFDNSATVALPPLVLDNPDVRREKIINLRACIYFKSPLLHLLYVAVVPTGVESEIHD
jgi:hypothetical protein